MQNSCVFERPDKILYDSSSCAVPETVQKLKAEVIVEDLALYPPETYNHFTFDKFLAFPSADSDMETFRKFADEHFLCFIHEDKAWELTQKNLSKATGIRFLADRLGVRSKTPMHSATARTIFLCCSSPETASQWATRIP